MTNVLAFHTSGSNLLRPAAFMPFIFSRTMSSSSSVNCPSLMSSWPLRVSSLGLSVKSGLFSIRFLKCSFQFWSLFSWLATFSFALKVIFLLLTSFTVCHAYFDCLISTEFLILLTWPRMYFSCYFWYLLSTWVFLNFYIILLVGFLLLSKDTFFRFISFFFNCVWLNIWLLIWLVYTQLLFLNGW